MKEDKTQEKSIKLTQELQKYTINQYENKIGSYDFTYWQGKKYKTNADIENILPDDKHLAINLYNVMYKLNPKEMNQWIDESPEFIHDWNGPVHEKYLKKASKMLKIADYKTIIKLINLMFRNQK